jgi:hypothetical protein
MRLRSLFDTLGLNDDSRRLGPHQSVFPAVVLLTVIVLIGGCAGKPAWDQEDAATIYERYRDVDLDYFFDAPPTDPTSQHPLYRGLKAKIDGRLDDAERHLKAATDAMPDSLRSFVYERLRDINERSYDWDDVVRYRSRTDSAFAADSKLGRVLANRSVPRLANAPDTATAPFEGLRTQVQINGASTSVPAVLDTGAPKTSVSRVMVERFDLPVDTSVAVGRSIVPALDLDMPQYATHIDRLEIGNVVIRNIPARVSWPEPDSNRSSDRSTRSIDDTDVFLGARLLRHVFDEIRYNYPDSTFTMIRDVPEREGPPNFAVMSDGWPIVRATAGGQAMAGVIDTGNLWVSRLHASSFPPSKYEKVGTRSGTAPNGYEWEIGVYRVPLEFPRGLRRDEMVIRGTGDKPYRLQANFGKDLWTEGTLVLDYKNRRAYYEESNTSDETN